MVKPFEDPTVNRIELFNEFFVCLMSLHINFYTDWVPTQKLRFQYGWSMIALASVMVTINLFFVISYAVNFYNLILKKYKIRFDHRFKKEGI